MRSVFLQTDKTVFKVDELPADALALAIGLPSAPKIKFLKKANKQRLRGAVATSGAATAKKTAPDYDALAPAPDVAGSGAAVSTAVVTKWDRLKNKQNADVLSGPYQKLRTAAPEEEEDEGSSLFAKATVQTHDAIDDGALPVLTSRKQRAKATKAAISKRELGSGARYTFDEEGNAVLDDRLAGVETRGRLTAELAATGQREMVEAQRSMELADILDREVHKEKQRAKRRARKEKERAMRLPEGFHEEAGGVYLDAPTLPLGSDYSGDETGGESAADSLASDGGGGYHSSSAAEEERDQETTMATEPRKRKGGEKEASGRGRGKRGRTLADDEELALALLGGGR